MANKPRKKNETQLLLALACGATVEQAARQCGLVARTVYRRLEDPEFRQELQKLRSDMVDRAVGMLTAAMGESAKTLVVLQKETVPYPSRLGAAKAVFDCGGKLREEHNLEQRLAELERNFEADKGDKPTR